MRSTPPADHQQASKVSAKAASVSGARAKLVFEVTMKRKVCAIVCMGLAVLVLHPPSAIPEKRVEKAELEQEAIRIVQRFAGTLKPLLKSAVQSGGLRHAINICSHEAPRIAQQLSRETGWNVKRVSLQPRNNKTAIPDPFEKKVLEQFDQRQRNGEPPASMTHSEIVQNRFRFLKAQAVEDICLNCHGKKVSADVAAALKKHYPQDTATGYSKGHLRGAFSLIKNLK